MTLFGHRMGPKVVPRPLLWVWGSILRSLSVMFYVPLAHGIRLTDGLEMDHFLSWFWVHYGSHLGPLWSSEHVL